MTLALAGCHTHCSTIGNYSFAAVLPHQTFGAACQMRCGRHIAAAVPVLPQV